MLMLVSLTLPATAQTLPGGTVPGASALFAGGSAGEPCASPFGCDKEQDADAMPQSMSTQTKPSMPKSAAPLHPATPENAESRREQATGNNARPEPQSEFQRFVSGSLGKQLPLYGYDLFKDAPDSFSPLDNVPITADYLIGPGDQLQVRGWGQVDFDLAVTVDRNGSIYLPKVGNVQVAGVRYGDLHASLKKAISRSFRNFDLNVSLGKLRAIQVFVVGQAQRPGVYTVSSLSTLINTVFASGGPSLNGSLRQIQLKRNGSMTSELDLYDFLLKGDKSKDVALLPGDVIYFPPVGPLAAITGSINNPAIYELKPNQTLAGLIWLAGGLTSTASGDKVRIERIDQRRMRKTEELMLDALGMQALLKDGDVVQVQTISGQFDNAITLRGNVANPGRYPWQTGMRIKDLIPDMDALIVPEYWVQQNRLFRKDIADEQHLRTQLMRNENEINWDYALVERLNKSDMSTALHPFNLGKALSGTDEDNNLLLLPGDVVTIFSKDDIQVPMAKRSVYVRLEGEFNQAGVYKVKPGETLRQLVQRAGGLTANAYLFASEFKRESVRQSQQQKLEDKIDRKSEDIERTVAMKSQTA
jgi:protein involved in polysaccharide export with SLBB domain